MDEIYYSKNMTKSLTIPSTLSDTLEKAFLDYFNNYLTVEKWAEHNGLSVEEGKQVLAIAKQLYTSKYN